MLFATHRRDEEQRRTPPTRTLRCGRGRGTVALLRLLQYHKGLLQSLQSLIARHLGAQKEVIRSTVLRQGLAVDLYILFFGGGRVWQF